MTDDIHSCGFHCTRAACVEARAREWEEQRRRIAELEAENETLKAALEIAFDYAMQNISEERQRFAGYKPERHTQWAKDEALMRAALAAKGE